VRQKFIIIKTLKYQSLSTIDHNKALIERKQEGIAQFAKGSKCALSNEKGFSLKTYLSMFCTMH
jgi:hypothetical protein